MKRLFLISLVTFFAVVKSNAQHRINCDSIYHHNDDTKSDFFILYESMPDVVGGFKSFYEQIERKFRNSNRGKVIVKFIVDTLGNVRCASVIKSDNKSLNDEALKFIEHTNFIPATQKGNPIVFVMALPIVFGEPSSDKKSGERKKN